ncbi:Uncharacterised protein [Mycobacteroides abscessus subsp. abscessus]|nr:Uncharacterised protein [Mycobacteroides abscessus subsp. abscessus]
MQIRTQLMIIGIDEAGRRVRGEHQQRLLVERKSEMTTAGQTYRVFECQMLTTLGADEITHARDSPHRVRRPPIPRCCCCRNRCR